MEDNENELIVNPQPPKKEQPPVDDSGLIDIAQKRKAAYEKKHVEYKRISRVVWAVVFIIGAVIFVGYVLKASRRTAPAGYTVAPTPTPDVTKPEEQTVTEWDVYKSDRVKVIIKKPANTKVLESSTPALKVEVVYDKRNPDTTSGLEKDLGEGYIFRVTPLDIGIRKIEDITKIKMDSFKAKCPATSTYSDVKKELISTIDALGFEVHNCDGDYIVHYIPRFGIYFEITEYYKGDFGYRQKYRATLDEILSAFAFYPEDTSPLGPFKTYIDEEDKFLFIHPNLDDTCCDTPKPPISDAKKIVVLGNKATFKDQDNLDAIGFYIYGRGFSTFEFNRFVEDQKKLLIEDYKVVRGVDPVVSQSEINIGEVHGIRLHGYTWQGHDLVYIELPGKWSNDRTLIVSIKNISGESFEKIITDIFSTIQSY